VTRTTPTSGPSRSRMRPRPRESPETPTASLKVSLHKSSMLSRLLDNRANLNKTDSVAIFSDIFRLDFGS